MTTTISPANAQKVWVFAQNPDGTLSPATIGGGGGSGTVTSIATSSPITGGPITTTGTIGCATCTTNAAALTNGNIVNGAGGQATVDSGIASANLITSAAIITNNVLPKGNGARGLVNSSITDSGTTVTTTEPFIITAAGAASQAAHTMSGALFTGGNGTTTFPFFYINQGNAPTTFNTAGTMIGLNAPTGFTGSFLSGFVNGGTVVVSINQVGSYATTGGNIATTNGTITGMKYATTTNCTATASPAVCASAASGIVQVAAAATSLQVNTTAVSANSRISLTYSTVGITPPTNMASMVQPNVSAITGGSSFTITLPVAPATNPINIHYIIID